MSSSISEVTAPQPSVARGVRRRVFWTLCILLLAFIAFAALVRTTILPPTSVLSYQFGFSPKPLLGEAVVDFSGWGWYPIKTELDSSGNARQVTFVRFLPLNEPEKNPITVFHRVEPFPDDFFLIEKDFPFGSAIFFKPGVLPNKQIHFAWIRNHQLFVAAKNDAELLAALSALEIKQNK